MTTDSIDSDSARPASAAEPPKAKRRPTNKAKPGKKAAKPTKPVKANSERSNKKAEVIALMRRAKGTTLAEIVKATGPRCRIHAVM